MSERCRASRNVERQSLHAIAARARAAIAALLIGCAAASAQNGDAEALTEGSRIDCDEAGQGAAVCSVDTATYVGWRVFNAQCASCHAQDALGSSFAPDLTARMRGMDAREFVAALDKGYLGPDDPSPPRGAMPDVARYYNELWSYLSARVAGQLPAGTLERLPNTGSAASD